VNSIKRKKLDRFVLIYRLMPENNSVDTDESYTCEIQNVVAIVIKNE